VIIWGAGARAQGLPLDLQAWQGRLAERAAAASRLGPLRLRARLSLTAVTVRCQFVDMNPASESLDESRLLDGLTILVVEDHEDSREAMRQFLEYLGARVLLARDGLEGVQLLKTEAPDVTLCDLRMPGMGGLRVHAASPRRESHLPPAGRGGHRPG
jgi:PleD family two-component response regulator